MVIMDKESSLSNEMGIGWTPFQESLKEFICNDPFTFRLQVGGISSQLSQKQLSTLIQYALS